MDHRQLHSFVVLAEELHFGKAALRLNIAQPALSQHIKALEQELGLMLFLRNRRNVALTHEGAQLLVDARLAVSHYDKIRETARSLRAGYKGQLRMGYVGSSIIDPVLAMLISGYRKENPHVDIDIEEHDVNQQLTLLLNDQLDIALIRTPVPRLEQLDYLEVATRPLIAVLPHHHPLLNKQRIALADLANEPFLIQKDPPGVGLGWSALSSCLRAGFTPQKIQFTRDVSVAIGLVAIGMGVTLAPETQLSVMLPEVGYCHLDDPLATTTLALSWQSHLHNHAVRDFIDYARELLC
ncbi:DNA-binding transcriptional LysR family regulator [Erwinia toletana]|uniref:DNA-binding transcriptional LysR family regulator n=1 Tax=Winslowiella toletana TaxID=92490 RepID=A0ABS4PCN6_9GAMM|nr:LysR substrate-binding domain-containing protein [Winslowiella toletana]MBP2169841.1 DNA-binding transcriptional LysR family regulator [Winslowiella toletana]